MTNEYKTREEWLVAATQKLQKQEFKPIGLEVPSDVKVSCSFPSSGGLGRRKRTIGQCFSRSCSDAKVNEVFISPIEDDAVEVMGTLVHELIHAIDDCANGHKKPFRDMAVLVGLEGKMTATTSGEVLIGKLKNIFDELGAYPHQKIDASQRKKQTTRMIKYECDCCGWEMRGSRQGAFSIQNHDCPTSCGGTLVGTR